jgi:SNF2 family DNA or RNA helicase
MTGYARKYDFPHVQGIKPMENQVKRFNFLLNNTNAFDLSDMGTGKTYTALWAADFLQREMGGSVLILAGKTTLDTIWRKSCADILGDNDRYKLLTGSGESRALYIKSHNTLFYISNYECLLMDSVRQALIASDVHTIIIDEVTAFKHANTSRSKYLRQVAFGRNVWGLTATPRPNSPLDCFGLAKAVQPSYKESFTRFRDRTHLKKGPFLWVPKDNAEESALAILQPSIRVRRDECYELPPCTTERRSVALSPEAKVLYKTLKREAYAKLAGERSISIANEGSLRNKLLQVCGGSVYAADKSIEHLSAGPRLDEVLGLLEQTNEKIVIFVPYRSQLLRLTQEIRDHGETVVPIHGDTKTKERADIIEAFQKLKTPRVIVADPRTMAHGVELTAASIIVFWLPVDSNELYQQAIGRLTRRGQANHVKVIQLCGTPLEGLIYDRVEARQGLQGALLEALEINEDTDEQEKPKKSRARTKPQRTDTRVSLPQN